LEGAQAGLSWDTIFAEAREIPEVFDGFDSEKVARMTRGKLRELLGDAGINRNRLKIDAGDGNARRFLKVREEFGTY